MRVVTSAPSKIILCGEHFVVYGAPALAIPTNNRNKIILRSTTLTGETPKIIMKSDVGESIYMNRKLEGRQELNVFAPVLNNILKEHVLDETIEIDILHSGAPKGMGSSSSIGVALGLALFSYLKRDYTEEDLFECGQLVDEIAHGGRPSGIDAKTAVRGRPQMFQRSFNPPSFNFQDVDINFPNSCSLIVVDTYKGERESTAELIERFAQAHGIEKKPAELTEEERRQLLRDYMIVYSEFLSQCHSEGSPERLGNAFNENHKLLMSVSTPEIEEVRTISLDAGAYGAKLTGAGGKGGAVIVLAPQSEKENIIKKLEERRYGAFSIEIAKEGAKVEMIL